jgi:hypothetical protein
VPGTTAQQMLRPLKHEVPTQMGKTDHITSHACVMSKNYAAGTSTRA